MELTINLDMNLREARETSEREFLLCSLEMCVNKYDWFGQERANLYRKLNSLG